MECLWCGLWCLSLWLWLRSWRVCGVEWHAENPRVSVHNVPVCTFKSTHVEKHVRVLPVYTETF